MTQPNEPTFAKAAFYHPDGGVDSPQQGLTKREYFASMALQGLLANEREVSYIAKKAVDYADALIKQLNEQS